MGISSNTDLTTQTHTSITTIIKMMKIVMMVMVVTLLTLMTATTATEDKCSPDKNDCSDGEKCQVDPVSRQICDKYSDVFPNFKCFYECLPTCIDGETVCGKWSDCMCDEPKKVDDNYDSRCRCAFKYVPY